MTALVESAARQAGVRARSSAVAPIEAVRERSGQERITATIQVSELILDQIGSRQATTMSQAANASAAQR
ncbi:MAG: hypothetical protein PVSMB9_10260 [Candidatus Dormibacteria bacterium]